MIQVWSFHCGPCLCGVLWASNFLETITLPAFQRNLLPPPSGSKSLRVPTKGLSYFTIPITFYNKFINLQHCVKHTVPLWRNFPWYSSIFEEKSWLLQHAVLVHHIQHAMLVNSLASFVVLQALQLILKIFNGSISTVHVTECRMSWWDRHECWIDQNLKTSRY